MSTNTNDYLHLRFSDAGDVVKGGVSVSFETQFSIYSNEVQKGYYSCYIPAFNIYYTACSFEDINILADCLVESFLEHGFTHFGYEGVRNKLKALNFFPPEGVWKTFQKKQKIEPTKFTKKLIKLPSSYNNYSKSTMSISKSLTKAA
jgi:hypothetical protein